LENNLEAPSRPLPLGASISAQPKLIEGNKKAYKPFEIVERRYEEDEVVVWFGYLMQSLSFPIGEREGDRGKIGEENPNEALYHTV